MAGGMPGSVEDMRPPKGLVDLRLPMFCSRLAETRERLERGSLVEVRARQILLPEDQVHTCE